MTNVEVKTTYPNGSWEIKVIDHDSRDERQWLGQHAFKALRKGAEVRTRPVSVTGSSGSR